MRVLSYNILDGGSDRADKLLRVISARKPDIVGLVEADDPAVVSRIADALGMDIIEAVGRKHRSALLSRWPILESINHALIHPDLTDCFLEATVRDESGHDWPIGLLHLHARAYEEDENRREEEIRIVLKAFEPHRAAGRAHFLMGDFNSNSPIQEIDPAKCKASTQKAWRANGDSIPRRVVTRILSAGYVDTLHVLAGLAAATSCTFTTEAPGQRIDYIFAHGLEKSRLKSAWIYKDSPAKSASDHFPVGLELR
jgi:exodeoxyribonuclease III